MHSDCHNHDNWYDVRDLLIVITNYEGSRRLQICKNLNIRKITRSTVIWLINSAIFKK